MQQYLVLALCLGSALARPDGAGGHHDHSHGHHSAPAAAPASGYAEPQAAYSEPATGYSEPTGYAAPTGYEAAPTGYGGNSGYGAVAEEGGIDMNMILIPILIIAGLALLFPSVTTVAVNRRKRSTEEEESGNSLVERVQDIYMAVTESEECMERVVCELGGIAHDAGINTKAISMASAFVPTKYSKMMRHFGATTNCHKIKCGSIF